MTTDTSKKPYKCNECGMIFAKLATLKQHHLRHNGVKLYKCKHCDQEYYLAGDLNRHVKSHYGIKEFQCSHCGMQYTRKEGLKKHIQKVHVGTSDNNCLEQKVPCKDCGKMFHPSSLRSHSRKHTGEKPYLCLRCLVGFCDPSSIRQHIRLHLKPGQVFCRNCQVIFESETKLTEHVAEAHGNKNCYQLYNSEEIEKMRKERRAKGLPVVERRKKKRDKDNQCSKYTEEMQLGVAYQKKITHDFTVEHNSLAGKEAAVVIECSSINKNPDELNIHNPQGVPEVLYLPQAMEEVEAKHETNCQEGESKWDSRENDTLLVTDEFLKQEPMDDAFEEDDLHPPSMSYNIEEIVLKQEDIKHEEIYQE